MSLIIHRLTILVAMLVLLAVGQLGQIVEVLRQGPTRDGETVAVEGVLLDKPIDALFVDFGESSITFRIRWWIDSYVDTRRMFDKVNEQLLDGFNQAGIKMPNMTYDLNLTVDEQNVRQFSEGVRKDRSAEEPGEIPDQN